MKFGTLFSGGELAGVGIAAAGWEHAWGVEYDPAIAAVAQANGFDVTVADVLACDPRDFAPVDALHASPVCTRASNANNSAELNDEGTKEAPLDIAMGEKVAEFIDVLSPRVVTIENVYAYRNFKAFGRITAALTRGGYFWDYDHLNAADFGVPQTRRRLILRAVKGALLPHLPAPVPWVGWYAAIEDLLDTLPTSQFAPWQLARLPEEISTIAFGNNAQEWGDSIVAECEPFHAVTTQMGGRTRAFLVDSKNVNQEYGKLHRAAAEPALTVTVDGKPSHMPRAWLVAPNIGPESRGDNWRAGDEPAQTATPNAVGRAKAFLVDGKLSTSGENKMLQINDEVTPSGTVVASHTAFRDARAWLSAGRVVAMTPRALARFQSVPDWYKLPEKNSLACKIIGNGVPCLLMQRVYEGLRPAPEQPR